MRFFALLSLLSCLGLSSLSALTPQELAKRQCRSVHLRHQPVPENSQAIYIESVPLKVSPGTYFSAANFDGGYIGFQELANKEHILIFSIWDPVAHGENPDDVPEADRVKAIKIGKKVDKAERFGNEGTGGKSFYKYPWKLKEKMKFLVIWKPIDDKFKQISGYFYDNHAKKWELIACWKTHRAAKEFSQAVSFVEDFKRDGESATKEREAAFGPVFVYTSEKKWVQTAKAGFTADPTDSPAVACDWSPEWKAYVLKTGGKTKTGDFKLWATQDMPKDSASKAPDETVTALVTAPLLKEEVSPALAK